MSLNEMLTCVREDIAVVAVVFNNGQWGAEKKNQVFCVINSTFIFINEISRSRFLLYFDYIGINFDNDFILFLIIINSLMKQFRINCDFLSTYSS